MIGSFEDTQELPAVVLEALPPRTPKTRPIVLVAAPEAPARPPTPWRVTNALTELWRRPESGRRLNRALWKLVQVHRSLGVIVVER